jgi:phage host-nuclease inhibitor protein Gam
MHKDAKKVAAKTKSKHSIFKSITVVGGMDEWKYEYVASPAQEEPSDYKIIREKFGNKNRDLNVDPDKSGEGGVFQEGLRVDDAPIVEDFRKSYNKLESWNILIKEKHPDLYEDFKIKFDTAAQKKPKPRTKRDELIQKIKGLTTEYKTKFRNLEEPHADRIKEKYNQEVNSIKAEIDSLLTQIASWYKSNTGKEAENVHKDGTELWRQAWKDAIVKVNTILASLWPQAKENIKAWVEQKKSERPDVNMEGKIGELDYIGSLAKGYKGPPKQYVRFNPENFDVDANLKAPPLAAYAMKVNDARPDRKRIFGRDTEITPLNDFSDQAHKQLIKVEGIKDEPDDKFDVVIEAEETTEQEQARGSTEKLYRLRPPKLTPEDYQNLIKKLKDKNLLEQGDGTVREDLTSQKYQELSEILADYKE